MFSTDRDDPGGDEVGVAATTLGEHPLRADGTVADDLVTVAAVIYDRLATPSRAYLDVRLEACREYAAERGWTVAAEHVDTGDAALDDRSRPGLDAALDDIRTAADEPGTDRAVLLVYNYSRLSHDALNLASWRHRVDLAGGNVATAGGEEAVTRPVLAEHAERVERRAAGAGQ